MSSSVLTILRPILVQEPAIQETAKESAIKEELLQVASKVSSTIKQINSLQEVEAFFDLAGEDTLGVFDIDETLVIPTDPAFQKPNMIKHAEVIQKIKGQLPLSQQDYFGNLILLATNSQLIESQSPLVIETLQKRGIRLITLTSAMTRQFEGRSLPEARYSELKSNGFDFSLAFPEIEHRRLTDLKPCYQDYPTFFRGVLCSNGDHQRQADATPKGEALYAFLKSTSWMPKKVIFVDDKLYNVKEMESTLQKCGIEFFQGLHYVGAERFTSPEVSQEVVESKWSEVLEKAKAIINE
ncbi:MAG: DUF2608 domain-containing protein [Chlamydiales bacterium]|nr:DUF2608 domain-containing protein [Chlamydiales bacterium]